MPAARHPWIAGPIDRVAVGYVLAVGVWLLLAEPGGDLTRQVGDLAFLPLGLVVGAAAWLNARRAADVRTRLAWQAISLGAFSLWGSGALYALFDPTLAGTEMKWWVSLLYFPFVAAGLTLFPRAPLAPADRARYVLDLMLSVVAGLVLVFFIELIASVHAAQEDPISRVTAAVVEWLAFVASAHAYLRASGAVQRRVFGAWLAAAVCYMAGNVAFGLVQYQPGHWVDGVWFAAWVCRWIGVRSPAAMAPAPFAAPREPGDRESYGHSAVPYLFLAGSFVLLLWAERAGHGFLPLAIGSGVMTTLLVLRHLVELRENRRLFAAQLAQQARFRSLVQQSSDVIVVLDARGRASYVSPSATRLFGEGCGLEAGADVLDRLTAEDDTDLRATLLAPDPPERVTATLALEQGARELEIVVSDLRADAAVGGLVLTCRDVTDRNELERQLRHAQKLEAVGQLAGGLAHEFNNLLVVIRGSAEQLTADLRGTDVSQQPLLQIEQCVDRAAGLTRQVLAFSRRQAVRATVLDLDRILGDLQPMLRQLLPPGIDVVMSPRAGGWLVKADQGQVEQVIVNLVANARDAMPAGGCLSIGTRPCLAGGDEPGTTAGEFVALEVTDEGTGIAPDLQARIFEPFFTTKPPGQGSGLGLSMVHGILSRAGGRIQVRSTPGQGSTFTALWPRTLEGPAPLAEAHPTEAPAGRGRRVLLVDDEPGVRHYVQRLLARHGFEVTAAADGEAALVAAARPGERIDILLTDLVMPGLSGRQLAIRFRELQPAAPVVCMTGFADEEQDVRPGDVITAVLTKPFRAETLLRTLDAAMEG